MTTAACVHWYSVATPAGEYSLGVCKHCGAERQFRNYEPETHKGNLWRPARTNKGGRPKKAVQA